MVKNTIDRTIKISNYKDKCASQKGIDTEQLRKSLRNGEYRC